MGCNYADEGNNRCAINSYIQNLISGHEEGFITLNVFPYTHKELSFSLINGKSNLLIAAFNRGHVLLHYYYLLLH